MGQPGSVSSSYFVLHPKVHLDDRRGQEGGVVDTEEPQEPGARQGREGKRVGEGGQLLDEEQRNSHRNGAYLSLLRSSQSGKN